MLKFARLSKLSSEGDVILKALQKSEEKLVEVDLENKKVRRNPEIPLPEVEDDEAKKLKTIYLKGFEKTNTTLDDLLGMQEKTLKGVFSKSSGKMIVAPIFCFSSYVYEILAPDRSF